MSTNTDPAAALTAGDALASATATASADVGVAALPEAAPVQPQPCRVRLGEVHARERRITGGVIDVAAAVHHGGDGASRHARRQLAQSTIARSHHGDHAGPANAPPRQVRRLFREFVDDDYRVRISPGGLATLAAEDVQTRVVDGGSTLPESPFFSESTPA